MLSHDDITLLLTVSEFRNISRAARVLYMSQSSMSKRIQDIEKYLGYEIFIRRPGQKTLEITKKGTELFPILSQIDRLNKEARNIRDSEENKILNIASSDGPYMLVIDDSVMDLYKKSPNWLFKLKNMSYRECVNAVAENIVDIAFIGNHIYRKNLDIVPLYREKMVFVCMPHAPYPEVINPQMLDVSKGIYSPYSSEFSSWFYSTFKRRCLIQCDLISEVKRFIYELNLWSIVPASVAADLAESFQVSVHPLNEDVPYRVIYYAVRRGENVEATEELLECIRERLRDKEGIDIFPRGTAF